MCSRIFILDISVVIYCVRRCCSCDRLSEIGLFCFYWVELEWRDGHEFCCSMLLCVCVYGSRLSDVAAADRPYRFRVGVHRRLNSIRRSSLKTENGLTGNWDCSHHRSFLELDCVEYNLLGCSFRRVPTFILFKKNFPIFRAIFLTDDNFGENNFFHSF